MKEGRSSGVAPVFLVSPVPTFFFTGIRRSRGEPSIGGIAPLQREPEDHLAPSLGPCVDLVAGLAQLGGIRETLEKAEVVVPDPLIRVAAAGADRVGVFSFYQDGEEFVRFVGAFLQRGGDISGDGFGRRLVMEIDEK